MAMATVHPLMIELVLQKVFENLPQGDLETCCDVNPLWRKYALKEFKIRAADPLELKSERQVVNAIKTMMSSKSQRGCRYSRLTLRFVSIENPNVPRLLSLVENYLTTLELFATQMTQLELKNLMLSLPALKDLGILTWTTENPPVAAHLSIFPFIEPSTGPNTRMLKFLNIRRLQFPSRSTVFDEKFGGPLLNLRVHPHQSIKTYLSETLETFPNVLELTVEDLAFEESSGFACLGPIRLNKFSLRITRASEGLSDRILKMLCDMDILVRHLDIKNHPVVPNPPSYALGAGGNPLKVNIGLLRTFIESQASTLEALELYQISDLGLTLPSTPSFCPFPLNLPNLKIIELHRAFVKNIGHVINHLPNLVEARFRFANDTEWKGILPNKLQKHEKLKTLRIEHIDGPSLIKLLKTFTNLENLHITNCNLKVLQALGEYFPEFLNKASTAAYYSECEQCRDNTPVLSARYYQIPFLDVNEGGGIWDISKSLVFPELKHIFLRKCKHYQCIGYFVPPVDKQGDEYMKEVNLFVKSLCIFQRCDGYGFQGQLWTLEPIPGIDATTFHLPNFHKDLACELRG